MALIAYFTAILPEYSFVIFKYAANKNIQVAKDDTILRNSFSTDSDVLCHNLGLPRDLIRARTNTRGIMHLNRAPISIMKEVVCNSF